MEIDIQRDADAAIRLYRRRPPYFRLLSAKNFYLGVGTKYATSIAYDDLDKKLVEDDKNARIGAVVFGGQAIDAARKALKADDGLAASDALRTASKRFGDFFARVPPADVAKARNAVAHLKAADSSKDGVICLLYTSPSPRDRG